MSLVRYSVSDEGEQRFSLMEMIRLYALERLAESGELEQTRDAHAAYYLALIEEAASDAHDADQAVWQEKHEWEASNLRAAFEWLMERKCKEEARRISRFLQDTRGKVSALNYLNTILPDRGDEANSPKIFPLRSTEPLSFITYEELTAREIDVLRLLALGLSNKKIAERLVISPHTVNGHIHSIFGKLALNSRSAATRYALEHQLA
jgi:DNA-binding CsgD family transcriptional regulator